MSLKEYRFVAILFSVFSCSLGLIAYLFILKEPSDTHFGITMLSNSIVVPRHNLLATEGWARTLLGFVSLFLSLYFGLGSIFCISQYIDLKKRS